jgi:N-acetylneuraminate synthase
VILDRLMVPGAVPYLVAEAGVNHEGDLGRAVEMVRRAGAMGVSAVKFQTYKADRLAVRRSPAYWDTSQEATPTQYELFSKYDRFGEPDYRRLAEECAAVGLDFLTSPFDVEAVGWLEDLVPMWKVASGDITNVRLLRRLGVTGKPVLLSTGASTIDEIAQGTAWLREAGTPEIALLHCTLSYPTETADANLGAIGALAREFPDCVPGYSDHTRPPASFAAIAAAYAVGARVIEKHYTLDKSLPGNDHYHAFDPDDFARLAGELRQLRSMLGSGVKEVLAAEQAARVGARRSLVARTRIPAGTRLSADLLDVKRPGTGIPPSFLDELDGWTAARDIDEDTTLDWEMLTRG